ncbi:phosphomevalonate kinase [Nocardiopsis rhodophaea]|uniref:phosphomevalonate kinase n=1 Tax=Nocardiopsis rhodophaea TaxID=280238 RepID=UPI0031D8EFE5
MTARTVTRHAPGKLYIAGEYAVMEPGNPAILMAVDRYVSVRVSGTCDADVAVASDLAPSETRLRRGKDGLCGCTADDEQRARNLLAPVVSVIDLLDELQAERGMAPPAMRVSITSALHDKGTKLGLGSSGAVTVATVAAVAAYCGIALPREARYRIALLATARLDARSSGGDLAASVWGGWIAYQAPDRAAVLDVARHHGIEETLRAPWPGLGVRELRPPGGLAVEVGWTGVPVATSSMVSRWRGSAAHRAFTAGTDDCVRGVIRALHRGDLHELVYRIRAARRLLAALDEEVGAGIFTSRLTALCDMAEAAGGAAKPSGAGGGDCGIAVVDATAQREIRELRTQWSAIGVRPVSVRAAAVKGEDG